MSTLTFLSGVTDHQMMSAVLLTPRFTVVIDGGMEADAESLAAYLRENGRDGVDAWFFTHPHQDHIGAFLALYRKSPAILKGRVCCRFPSPERLFSAPAHSEEERELWRELLGYLTGSLAPRHHLLQRGDRFVFDDVTLSVPWAFEESLSFPRNFVNNSSSVFLLSGEKNSVLILGDLGVGGGDEMLKRISPTELFADYTQLSHHGQLGLSEAAYRAICPKKCIWPTPDKIWRNLGPEGEGSGKWRCRETMDWMDRIGVREHFFTKDQRVTVPLS